MAEQEFFVRDTRLPGHFWADNEVLDIYGELLGAHGFAVYMVLARYAINGTGECKVSMSRIARQVNMSKGGVFNALQLISKLGLIRILSSGDARNPGIYVLADVKSMVNPNILQMRLSSVHTVNAQADSVHGVNANVHTVNAGVQVMNAAFTGRTPNKEDKTSSRLKTNKTAEHVCSKCQNKGTHSLKGHPGEEVYCGCVIGKSLQRAEVRA